MTLWPRDKVGHLHPATARVAHRLREHGLEVEIAACGDALGVEPSEIVESRVYLRAGAPIVVLCDEVVRK